MPSYTKINKRKSWKEMHQKRIPAGLYPEQRPMSALTVQTTTSRSSHPSFTLGEETIVVNHQKLLEEEDLSYRPHTGAGATTLTNTSAIENLSFSEYEDLLVLAQQHFDDLRRILTNRSGEGRRPGSNVIKYPSRSSKKTGLSKEAQHQSNQLLSTLLYLSLMMNKVEEVKSILKQVDINVYNEWSVLITFLHPPPYYIRDRRMQTDRARRIYQRKVHYKRQVQLFTTQLEEQQDIATRTQKQASETIQQMSTNIAHLMEENVTLRAHLASKEQVESELSKSSTEVRLLQGKLNDMGQKYEQLLAEMTLKIRSHEEAIIENTKNIKQLEEEKLKAETSRLLQQHEKTVIEISDEVHFYKSQSKLLEGKLEDKSTALTHIQDQANDTAQKMSASITCLMDEAKNLRSQLSQKHDVEVRLSAATKEVESLSSKLDETTQSLEQLQVETTVIKTLNQQALAESNEKLLSAYDRAAKSETELMVTKKTLAETTDFLTSTRKDLNDAKDSLAKALDMHAEKTESEMKIEENLKQVTTACRYTNDLLNMMDAKLDDFQTSTKTSTLSLGNEIEHSNATLGRVCDKVAAIESTAKQIASSQDLCSANNEKSFNKINHSIDEIASKTHSINLAQEKTFTEVCKIACKSDEIASTLTIDNETSNVTLNDIQQKVASIANKTVNIANVQDEVTKCLLDKLNRSSCSLESIDDIIKKILTLQDSTLSSVENVQRVTVSLMDERDMDKKELNAALGDIHDRLAAVETCTKDTASVQTDTSTTIVRCNKDVKGCLDSVKSINSAICSLQDAAASSVMKLDLLETNINESLLLTKSSIENESSNLNIALDKIHGKVSKIDEKVDRVVTAHDVVHESVVEEFQKCNTKLESIDEISKQIKYIHDATSKVVGSIDAKAEAILANQSKDAKEIISTLEKVNAMVSEAASEVKQSSHANNIANVTLAKSMGELGVSIDFIETNTKSILSLNESTSLSISNLERINKEIESEVLSKNDSRKSETSNLNFVLEQLQGKLAELSTASDNLALSQTLANAQASEKIQKLGSSIEDIDERIRFVQLAQQSEVEGIDNLNTKADIIFSSQEKDMLELNTSIRNIDEKVSLTEYFVKKVDQLTSALDSIEADTKLITVLRDETKRSTSAFERLDSCLNEQLMLARRNKGQDLWSVSPVQGKVGNESNSSERSISSINGINNVTKTSQWNDSQELFSLNTNKSSTGNESLILNQENNFERYMELPSTVRKESSGFSPAECVSFFKQPEEAIDEKKKSRDSPIGKIARPFLDPDTENLRHNMELDDNSASLHISIEPREFIIKERQEIKNHENHEQSTVTVPNFDVGSSVNISRVSLQALQFASEQINNDVSASNVLNHSSIQEAFEVRRPCSCSEAYTASEIAVRSEVNNEQAEELPSEELDKDSFLENERDDCVIEESPEDNHNTSEENVKEGNKSVMSDDKTAIEKKVPKDNHNTSEENLKEGNKSVVSHHTSAVEYDELHEEVKGSADEQEEDLEALAKLAIIHATALVHVGLIQVDAIERASITIG